MSILYQLKPLVKLDPKYAIDELFLEPREQRKWSFAPVNEPGLMSWGGLFSIGAKAVKALSLRRRP